MAEVNLGLTADLHHSFGDDLNKLRKIIAHQNEMRLDGYIINGDMVRGFGVLSDVLWEFRKFDGQVYIMSGSHESTREYELCMKTLADECGFINLDDVKRATVNGFDLVGLSGTDHMTFEGMDPADVKRVDAKVVVELENYIQNPERTLLVSHHPPLGLADQAHFIVNKADGGIMPYSEQTAPVLTQHPEMFMEQKKHVGSELLRDALDKYGLTKVICGHIHEAGPLGVTLDGTVISPEQWSRELVLNPGDAWTRNLFATYSLRSENGKVEAMYESFSV